jgi:hypothetical protein
MRLESADGIQVFTAEYGASAHAIGGMDGVSTHKHLLVKEKPGI